MQQLEVLYYSNALDVNMGYYTISLSPANHYMTVIVTEFCKFGYNRLHIDKIHDSLWKSSSV